MHLMVSLFIFENASYDQLLFFVWLVQVSDVVQCSYVTDSNKRRYHCRTSLSVNGPWRLAMRYSDETGDEPMSAMSVSNRGANCFITAYDTRCFTITQYTNNNTVPYIIIRHLFVIHCAPLIFTNNSQTAANCRRYRRCG